MLVTAIIFINLALVFYTIGVWGEKRAGTLTNKHLFFFILGLICDTTGTLLMSEIAKGTGDNAAHAITGAIALILMLIHAVWAIVVKWKGSDKSKQSFHRFSIIVWALWLIPYGIGVAMSMF
ncbi:HsmA family protein [Paenibacillus sp. FSL K6-0276]|uniref:HsmA family protein n=1 Tax=Paenibacillus sp. FSL K6-0276 TaxID=2921450 RepID=UPI0030EBA528